MPLIKYFTKIKVHNNLLESYQYSVSIQWPFIRQLCKTSSIRFNGNAGQYKQTNLTSIRPYPRYSHICSVNQQNHRSFSTSSRCDDDDDKQKNKPANERILPDFGHAPITGGPSFIQILKTWLNITFIEFNLDTNFKLDEFQEGSRTALEVNSIFKSG